MRKVINRTSGVKVHVSGLPLARLWQVFCASQCLNGS